MSATFYKVGGTVRDKILGMKPKDIDFAVEAPSYQEMVDAIKARGGEIFLERPEFFTVRGKLPDVGAADFTLCRKEGFYSDNRHPDSVDVGTILEDLARRDFTVNAIAEKEDGTLIDPYNGRNDALLGKLRCVGKTMDRFNEDPLRMLRAIRFCVCKRFQMSGEIFLALKNVDLLNKLFYYVAKERAYEELRKCFEHDTLETLTTLDDFRLLRTFLFEGMYGLSLTPVIREK